MPHNRIVEADGMNGLSDVDHAHRDQRRNHQQRPGVIAIHRQRQHQEQQPGQHQQGEGRVAHRPVQEQRPVGATGGMGLCAATIGGAGGGHAGAPAMAAPSASSGPNNSTSSPRTSPVTPGTRRTASSVPST